MCQELHWRFINSSSLTLMLSRLLGPPSPTAQTTLPNSLPGPCHLSFTEYRERPFKSGGGATVFCSHHHDSRLSQGRVRVSHWSPLSPQVSTTSPPLVALRSAPDTWASLLAPESRGHTATSCLCSWSPQCGALPHVRSWLTALRPPALRSNESCPVRPFQTIPIKLHPACLNTLLVSSF